MSKFIYGLSLSLSLVALTLTTGCADMPEGPAPEGVSASFVDSNGLGRGEVHLRLSLLSPYYTPFVDMDTARLYVRQWQKGGGQAKLTIIEPGSDPSADCGYFRASSGPAAITFVVDRSHLGGEEIARNLIRGAAASLVDVGDDVRFAVVNVGPEVSFDQPLTGDLTRVEDALRTRTVELGGLSLLAGIEVATADLAENVDLAYTRGAVIVLAGALDTVSGAERSYGSVADKARASGVPVFVVGYGDAGVPRPEEGDLGGLWTIAEASGGRYIPGASPLYAEHLVPALVESIGRSYEVCVEAMVLSDGSDYAGVENFSRLQVAVEADGGALETERKF